MKLRMRSTFNTSIILRDFAWMYRSIHHKEDKPNKRRKETKTIERRFHTKESYQKHQPHCTNEQDCTPKVSVLPLSCGNDALRNLTTLSRKHKVGDKCRDRPVTTCMLKTDHSLVRPDEQVTVCMLRSLPSTSSPIQYVSARKTVERKGVSSSAPRNGRKFSECTLFLWSSPKNR